MRDRLTAHRSDPTCAGCHKLMDPIGLRARELRFGRRVSHGRERPADRYERRARRRGVQRCRRARTRNTRQSCDGSLSRAPALLLCDRPRARTARYRVGKVPRGSVSHRKRLPGAPDLDAADRSEREFLPRRPALRKRRGHLRDAGLDGRTERGDWTMNSVSRLSRRRVLRGMMGGAAVSVGLPFLDCFLDSNGAALAATGARLPACFGTWFYGCGFNPGRWEPSDQWGRTTNLVSSDASRSAPFKAPTQRLQPDDGAARRPAARGSHGRSRGDRSGNDASDSGASDESRAEHRCADRRCDRKSDAIPLAGSLLYRPPGEQPQQAQRLCDQSVGNLSPGTLHPHFRIRIQGPECRGFHPRSLRSWHRRSVLSGGPASRPRGS